MYQAVITFFTEFFGADFDVSVLSALFVGFTVMLIYGIIVRPWLNIVGGTKK